MRKILILLLLPLFAFATESIIVSSPDHAQIMHLVFEGINYFYGIGNTVNTGAVKYLSFINLMMVLGTTWVLIQLAMSAMSGSTTQGFRQYLIYLIMLFAMGILIYGPKTDVLIQTKDNSSYATANDVPYFIAFTLSMFTTMQYEMNNMSQEAFGVPDPTDNFPSGGNNGFGFMGGREHSGQSRKTSDFQ